MKTLGMGSFAAVILATATGCVSGAQLAVQRASREYDCPESEFEATWLSYAEEGNSIYKVEGCGIVATYVCDEVASSCIKESDDRRSP